MKIMLDVSPHKLQQCSIRYGHDFWQLLTPLRINKLAGVPYGIDNGCFGDFKEKEFEQLLENARHQECLIDGNRPKFICIPDFVGSAVRTMDLYDIFKRKLNGLPAALVLQDGIGNIRIPWDEIAAVFVGGTDKFKISQEAMDACKLAKMLGKWVRVGRVNSTQRALYFISSGISRA